MVFRSEPILALDLFHKPLMREHLDGLAQTIQNILLISPGTLPNDPLFGVGLERYLFEILNEATMSTLRDSIEEQLARYVVHEDITVNVEVKPLKTEVSDVNTLMITVRLYESSTSVSEPDNEPIELGFAYAGNSATRKTISKIIL